YLGMLSETNSSTSTRQTKAQKLLGVFVVWQIFFILTGNLWKFAEDKWQSTKEEEGKKDFKELPAQRYIREGFHPIVAIPMCWGGLSGQYQAWCMFAPYITK